MKNNYLIHTIYVVLIIAVISPAFAMSDFLQAIAQSPVKNKQDESNLFIRTDQRIFDFIYDETPRIQFLGHTMDGITKLGDDEAVLGLTLLLVAFGNEHQFETGKLMTVAFSGTGIAIFTLKQIVGRTRPLEEKSGLSSSFPSGHTGNAFALVTVISNQYPRLRIPLYLGATLVGISRIYLGRHYPSDVLIGAAMGTLTAAEVVRHKEFFLKWQF